MRYSSNASMGTPIDLGDVMNATAANCTDWNWCGQGNVLLVLEIVVIVMCVAGSFGNLITVLAICFSSLRSNVNCVLIGSLSSAGFLYCALILPFQAVIFHKAMENQQDGPHDLIPVNFCLAAGGIRYSLVGVIMTHLGAIAFYRFCNVVRLPLYYRVSKTQPLVSIITLCWIIPLIFTLPPSFNLWGSFKFVPSVLACTFPAENGIDQSNRILTVTLGFIVPCIFIVFCYARIGCVAYGSSKRISQWRGNNVQTKALRLSIMMMCIFVMFFLGTFPYFIVNVTDKHFDKPLHHIWTTMLGWLLYCSNPIVYTIMDQNFRTAYRRILIGDCEKNPIKRGHKHATPV